ncbi:MAG: site-2 protease family protein [Elusimicrobiota bacterium]
MPPPPETPLQRLRRLEKEEAARKAPGGARAGKTLAAGGGLALALAKGKVALMFLFGQFKFIFLAFKFLPFLGTLFTMVLSAQLYARLYGASLAWGLVGLILLHEFGHGAVARSLGLRVGAPVFIPFFGAVIAMKEQPRSTWIESRVAAGGPAAGLFGAAACAASAALRPGSPHAGLLMALAQITSTINLFNLFPAAGLDGDRITQPFARAHWLAALAALAAACAASSLAAGRLDAMTFMVLLGAAVKAWRTRAGAPARLLDRLEAAGRYHAEEETTPGRRRAAAAVYAALALALSGLASWSGSRAARSAEERQAPNLISWRPVKKLYLMRHGHSPTSAEAGVKSDALRPLSDKGRRDAKLMAGEILKRGGRPSLLLHSPLLRAVQTAGDAALALKAPAEPFPLLDNTRPAEEVLAALEKRAAAVDELIAVGHQPQIGELAALLTDRILEIRPAGVVAIEWAPEPRLLWTLNADELAT